MLCGRIIAGVIALQMDRILRDSAARVIILVSELNLVSLLVGQLFLQDGSVRVINPRL